MRQRILAGIILSLTASTSNAALLGRVPLTPGGTDYQAYYDTVLNITWLANANLAASQPFGLPVVPPPGPSHPFNPGAGEVTTLGQMQFDTTTTWLAAMNAAGYLNVNDWRLPSMDVNGDSVVADCHSVTEVACRDNEIFYQEAYNSVQQIFPCGTGICFGGPFSNVAADYYWTATPAGASAQRVFYFPIGGETAAISKTTGLFVWPVRNGDIAVAPIPAAVWLLGSALGVLGWVRRTA